MGTLEDALRKSGLVSKKQAKQARHKKRVHRSEVGREGLEAERLEKERVYQEQIEKQKDADQRLEAERAEKEAAERARIAFRGGATGRMGSADGSGPDGGVRSGPHSGDAQNPATLETIGDRIYRGALSRTGGPKQYFFVLNGGQTRHVEVNDDTFCRLQDGGAGIVRPFAAEGETVNPFHFVIVDRNTALQVRAIIPDCLLELQPERGFGSRR